MAQTYSQTGRGRGCQQHTARAGQAVAEAKRAAGTAAREATVLK